MSVEHNFKWKNNGRTKVMIGCGTRPEIIRLAAVIKDAENISTVASCITTRTGIEI